ncbi:MAG: hypothetical protein U0586_17140 [Candidatus Brocadiaceae bacterium]
MDKDFPEPCVCQITPPRLCSGKARLATTLLMRSTPVFTAKNFWYLAIFFYRSAAFNLKGNKITDNV